MYRYFKWLLGLYISLAAMKVQAQANRLSDKNLIGWYNVFATLPAGNKTGIHLEYQWRRDELITQWQQSLLRLGFNYALHKQVQLRLGYAWIETFNYGDFPLNPYGKPFTEHRFYEMLTVNNPVGKHELSHRFMLEQRLVGKYADALDETERTYPLLHRFRYMFRWQLPLTKADHSQAYPYAAMYDELFVGFGKNVGENVFDQNRLGALLGYRFNAKFRIEGGFLSQIVQLSREINNRNVFQYNNGLIINAYLQPSGIRRR